MRRLAAFGYSLNMAAMNTQFAVSLHLLAALGSVEGGSCSSAYLAGSVNATPSFVRRILAMLVEAGLVKTTRGAAGCCTLARPASAISLLDVYRAVRPPKVFALHDYPKQERCSISCRMKTATSSLLDDVQEGMEAVLRERSLACFIDSLGVGRRTASKSVQVGQSQSDAASGSHISVETPCE